PSLCNTRCENYRNCLKNEEANCERYKGNCRCITQNHSMNTHQLIDLAAQFASSLLTPNSYDENRDDPTDYSD
ncbi:unnamed protein product, partial [Onchocerca ochengi]